MADWLHKKVISYSRASKREPYVLILISLVEGYFLLRCPCHALCIYIQRRCAVAVASEAGERVRGAAEGAPAAR